MEGSSTKANEPSLKLRERTLGRSLLYEQQVHALVFAWLSTN